MKWSLKMGEIAGIGVYVHTTFFMLIAWIAMVSWAEGQTVGAMVVGVGFILALFGCIVLHELGHALAARRYNIQTRDITLLSMGGPFLQRLFFVNLFIAVFNLIPAFPMDGGRVLRALLATRMDYVTATQIAANVGQAMAFAFGLIGLFVNPFLIFIALFVWIGAAAEASMVQMKSALAGIPVAQAMVRNFQTLEVGDLLSRAVEITLEGSQKDFPVLERGTVALERGTVAGILSQERLLAALAKDGPEAAVASALQENVATADSHEMLEGVLAGLESSACETLPVTHGGALVGLLTLDNIGELVRIQAALKGRAERRGSGVR